RERCRERCRSSSLQSGPPSRGFPVGRVVDLVCAEQPAHAVGQLALADTVGLGLRLLGKARGRVAIGVDLVADGATLFIPAVKQSQEQVVYPLLARHPLEASRCWPW